jgi:hypothetical protein
MRKMRNIYILDRKSEGTRLLACHMCIWEDNIKMNLKGMARLIYK